MMQITARPIVHFAKKPAVQPKQQHEAKQQILADKPAAQQIGGQIGV